MAKLATATWKGKSGRSYEFDVYPIGTTFKALGAVYIFSRRTTDLNGKVTHDLAYIGQTGDLSERFDNHHKAPAIKKRGANAISIHLNGVESQRLNIETDLCRLHNPPCNG